MNNRINNIHERALRLVYNDSYSSFNNLLDKDKSVSIHMRNIQDVAIELFKVYTGVASESFCQNFQLKQKCIHESRFPFKSRNICTSHFGIDSLHR